MVLIREWGRGFLIFVILYQAHYSLLWFICSVYFYIALKINVYLFNSLHWPPVYFKPLNKSRHRAVKVVGVWKRFQQISLGATDSNNKLEWMIGTNSTRITNPPYQYMNSHEVIQKITFKCPTTPVK